jgi:hypothetical protein
MKAPLAIYVVYHTHNVNAHEIFSKIYKVFCRDIRNSLSDGLDIPVYFATEETNFTIDFERAEKTFVLVLADDELVRAKDSIIPKIREWRALDPSEDKIMICPVQLSDYSFDLFPSDVPEQFIKLPSFDVKANWLEFQTRIYDSLIRLVQIKHDKLRVFVSHSKRDADKLGTNRAKDLVQYLNEETKLDSFFDVKDILEGKCFDKQIEKGVENALLMVLYTNTYSDREWCRRELIAAKDHDVPTVVVMMMNGVAKRVFPYIGNIPCIEFAGDWREPINLLLRTALDEYYEKQLLESLCAGRSEVMVNPFPPELYNLRSLQDGITQVLYPEPPLGQEELSILKQAHEAVDFVTPMEYASVGMNLEGKYIAISISNSEDAHKYGVGQEMLDDISIEISKHILKVGGKMIYGGVLRDGSFTELFANLSDQYGAFEKSASTIRYFKNFIAWPNYETITAADENKYEHNRVELVRVEKEKDEPTSLTKMRVEMENNAHARIVVGGRMMGYSGIMPGIIEEFKIAIEADHPVYVVGGFGGAARYVANVLSGVTEVEDSFAWMKGLNISNLRNGLSEEENKRLFVSTNAMEIVSLILKGLKNSL